MLIALHKNATTTPATRVAIQSATGSDYELAGPSGVSRDTAEAGASIEQVLAATDARLIVDPALQDG